MKTSDGKEIPDLSSNLKFQLNWFKKNNKTWVYITKISRGRSVSTYSLILFLTLSIHYSVLFVDFIPESAFSMEQDSVAILTLDGGISSRQRKKPSFLNHQI